jgi:serine/threonine protein kinase
MRAPELEAISPAMVSLANELGKGRFKRVFKAWHKHKSSVAAVRYTKGDATTENEIAILTLLAQHGGDTFVPRVHGIIDEPHRTTLVQEFASCGALKIALKNADLSSKITSTHKLHCAYQMSRAMAFLASLNIVHADLSCRNVLLFRLEKLPSFTVVKITDFALAIRVSADVGSQCVKQPQATRWCAPETVAEMKYSSRSDAWSLGATFWELFSGGTTPWCKRTKRGEVAARLRDLAQTSGSQEGGPDMSKDFPPCSKLPAVNEVILECLRSMEHQRFTFSEMADAFVDIISADTGNRPGGLESRKPPIPNFRPALSPASSTGKLSQAKREASQVKIGPVEKKPRESIASESTADSSKNVSLNGSFEGGGVQHEDERIQNGARRMETLKDFLKSSAACEMLGEQTVNAMQHELLEAEVREAYWKVMTKGMMARFGQLEAQIQEAKAIATTSAVVQAEKPIDAPKFGISDENAPVRPTSGHIFAEKVKQDNSWISSFSNQAVQRRRVMQDQDSSFEFQVQSRLSSPVKWMPGTLAAPAPVQNPRRYLRHGPYNLNF